MNMRTDKYLWKICDEIYTQMYKEATPPADWEDIKKQAEKEKLKENWFSDHYLEHKRQKEIVNNAYKKYNCSKFEKRKIDFEIWLGCSPSMIK